MNVAVAWLITWVVGFFALMYFGWDAIPGMVNRLTFNLGISPLVAAMIFGAIWAVIAVVPFLILTREHLR